MRKRPVTVIGALLLLLLLLDRRLSWWACIRCLHSLLSQCCFGLHREREREARIENRLNELARLPFDEGRRHLRGSSLRLPLSLSKPDGKLARLETWQPNRIV